MLDDKSGLSTYQLGSVQTLVLRHQCKMVQMLEAAQDQKGIPCLGRVLVRFQRRTKRYRRMSTFAGVPLELMPLQRLL